MPHGTRTPRWMRYMTGSRNRLFDWFPPAALLALAIPELVRPHQRVLLDLALTLLLIAPLVVRRRYPMLVFALVFSAALVQWLAGEHLEAANALLVAFYTVASLRSARTTLAAAIALEAAVAFAIARFAPAREWLLAFVLLSGLVTAAGVLGVYARTRAALLAQLHERADRLERERDQQVELAGADERARIAREMHDVVAHHLTVMIALAEGAAASVATAPDRAAEVMTTVSATGRKALADTRRLLGVLRTDSDAQLQPQPDISRVEMLLEQVRSAGLPATMTITGRHRVLSAALQLTVYRLIQEALTNTLKHAGPGAHVRVRLTYTDDAVNIDVRDDGLGSTAVPLVGLQPEGHGLTGMRERVAAWDGELRAGPASPYGWVVSARLPTEAVDATAGN
ncbi:MAG: two-component sensor histidine kinase [Pseudonocardiales bacterium]|nr:MAG: two-component sensor histidine kinase [Pseudonocardiales bacterium]